MSAAMESLIAHTILQGSDAMFGRFLDVTAEAQQRFEHQQWTLVHQALKTRISFYDHHVELVTNQIQIMLGGRYANQVCLTAVKQAYQNLLVDYPRYDIAESFFNSVYCRIFKHRNINRDNIFVHSSQQHRIPTYPSSLTRHYRIQTTVAAMIERMLDDQSFTLDWNDKQRDIQLLITHLEAELGDKIDQQLTLEQIREPFYRNKAAYLVGKLTFSNGESLPLVLPILNHHGELLLDAGICNVNDVSVIFGFARSYFMVYSPAPAALVRFLAQLLPNKNLAELYTAIGCQKHGKTEFYRQFLDHLDNSDDKFIIAPGIKGMVMSVFTLPSYDFVFKIIKDKFAPQKDISHQTVKQKYQLVKEHDRVGRMADTQEYRHFSFPRHRFSDELINELLTIAPSIVSVTTDEVIIEHLYMERRMIPFNIYIETANDTDLRYAVNEYGNAIKQLAAANIFPGDMLFKNFGVTRHKRVVFYDYDEITYMSEMNFRTIPAARYPEDEMAAEPWYSVGVNDVFPEEFRTFLLINPKVRTLFNELHQDLFEASYWQHLQANISQELYPDVFPYQNHHRLHINTKGESFS
ncbi:bifunctional isocitrate dehydrogenase kinase/phosphatase [Photobacterium phosphoreum]|jgi:isocitrate dehydrogenase kinase/phosphatase|uniref:Isocitrate dehydrogenase kinase/phosphatase n=1 Tax=Photobacterium phosphoreum TaxID=659 RepID=A0AAW4ZW97_PHOPO|nr:bifunctional isocitrate dehydrogenase kinase/phosphatase [Photobacterium phosphoreum]KJF88112.1 isocitrate dehydrogenase [Photobacterium phosphoreum]MCD9463913.1 bifunctional isocitrate dehydrogenase kinase/phosphatase [Photobacterium phosphoreum]MCD9474907.1 bifunctional isocitrate dehydrogenase kinase/phosphatase [Photobacterium phosphoreum]MCD9479479.1 bifunctional isocitrate dehydrogenase kinase/phosphatase [Photobacterium phosphoreum]MCD9484057.1 bifunctional isocitrate dehydrogenase k